MDRRLSELAGLVDAELTPEQAEEIITEAQRLLRSPAATTNQAQWLRELIAHVQSRMPLDLAIATLQARLDQPQGASELRQIAAEAFALSQRPGVVSAQRQALINIDAKARELAKTAPAIASHRVPLTGAATLSPDTTEILCRVNRVNVPFGDVFILVAKAYLAVTLLTAIVLLFAALIGALFGVTFTLFS